MDTIYMDQLTTLIPKGDGVEEAMEAAVNMDISDIQTMADETREQYLKEHPSSIGIRLLRLK